jgi:hypothetical protein
MDFSRKQDYRRGGSRRRGGRPVGPAPAQAWAVRAGELAVLHGRA